MNYLLVPPQDSVRVVGAAALAAAQLSEGSKRVTRASCISRVFRRALIWS